LCVFLWPPCRTNHLGFDCPPRCFFFIFMLKFFWLFELRVRFYFFCSPRHARTFLIPPRRLPPFSLFLFPLWSLFFPFLLTSVSWQSIFPPSHCFRLAIRLFWSFSLFVIFSFLFFPPSPPFLPVLAPPSQRGVSLGFFSLNVAVDGPPPSSFPPAFPPVPAGFSPSYFFFSALFFSPSFFCLSRRSVADFFQFPPPVLDAEVFVGVPLAGFFLPPPQ